MSQVKQLEKEILDVLEGAAPPLALPRWALIRYTRLPRRRVFAVLFDTKGQAIANADPDEVLVRVNVTIEKLYR